MNYKKITAFASAVVMLTSLTACGKDEVSENAGESVAVSAVADTSDTDESSEASDVSESDDTSESKSDKKDNKKDKDKSKEKTTEKASQASTKNPKTSGAAQNSSNKGGNSGSSDNSSDNSSDDNSEENGSSDSSDKKPSSSGSKATSAVSDSKKDNAKTTAAQNKPSGGNSVTTAKSASGNNKPASDNGSSSGNNSTSDNKPSSGGNDPASENKPSSGENSTPDSKPSEDKPSGNTPSEDKPGGDAPAEDKPSGSKPAETAKPVTPDKPAETTPAPTEAPKEEKVYDGEIVFDGSPTASGANVSVDGSKVKITAGGDYIIRGSSSDGQIIVDTETEEKVEITLDGVDITCSDGPAVMINEAKKCTLKIAGGTENRLSDGGKDKVNDGVIFTNDTLRIKGGGKLEINAVNAHGIASDDDIIIENGEIVINSKKSGIFAHDDITLNGGELTIFGGTNGIKSKGTVHINGGTAWVCGGSKEEKSSIYASTGLFYSGGSVYAAGNAVTPPNDDSVRYIVVKWNGGVSADSTVGFVLGGLEFAKLTPKNPFKCIMMLSTEIENGDVFTPTVDGEEQGSFDVGDGQNLFVVK